MMQEIGYCAGIENYSRHLSGARRASRRRACSTICRRNVLLVVDETHQTMPQLGAMYRGDRARKEMLVEYGFRLPSALDNRPLKFEECEQLAPQMIYVSATPGRLRGRSTRRRWSSSSFARRGSSIRRSRCARWARRSTTCCRR